MTDRMRRHRARMASGRVILPIEVNLSELGDALVEAGWLEAWDQDDRKAIGRGLERLIDHLISVGGDA